MAKKTIEHGKVLKKHVDSRFTVLLFSAEENSMTISHKKHYTKKQTLKSKQ